MGKTLTHEIFIERFKQLDSNINILGYYINQNTKIDCQCEYGHIWSSLPHNILKGSGCPYCAGKKILIGFNDLWTTRPDVAKMLNNPDDGYRYTYGSSKKVYFVCPDCNTILTKKVAAVSLMGLHCDCCSDGISYPNKFARALLSELPIDTVNYEWQPDWAKPYLYDNYFEYNNKQYILEMDGGLGHGCYTYNSQDIDEIGIKRDAIKDDLAKANGIHVIRIDCNYGFNYNRFEYIKNNILNSELDKIVDLSKINWSLCHKQALTSLVVKTATLYNEGYAVSEISQFLGHVSGTITRWLKQAKLAGLCDYNKDETKRRSIQLISYRVNQYTLDGKFVASYSSISEAYKITNINMQMISKCCKKQSKSTGGYLWFFADDLNQPDQTKVFSK